MFLDLVKLRLDSPGSIRLSNFTFIFPISYSITFDAQGAKSILSLLPFHTFNSLLTISTCDTYLHVHVKFAHNVVLAIGNGEILSF